MTVLRRGGLVPPRDDGPVTAFRYIPWELLVLAVVLAAVASVVASLPALRRRDARGAWTAVTRVLLVGAVLAVLAVTLTGGAPATGVNLVPGEGIGPHCATRTASSGWSTSWATS